MVSIKLLITGKAFTVIAFTTLAVDTQPLPSVTVYVIFVEPPSNPVTTPVFTTVPLLTALDVHAVLLYVPDPPLGFDVNGIVKPTHTSLAPVIVPAFGNALITIIIGVAEVLDKFELSDVFKKIA